MQRVLSLRGGRNFRDLGGYLGADGRPVRWRRVFRSGVMSYLTQEDREQIAKLGIRVSCDFRDPHERAREPNSWDDAGVLQLTWDDTPSSLELRKLLRGRDLTADITRTAMDAYYRRLPARFEKQFATMLLTLAQGRLPMVINCAAGKDRTGMAAAVILASVGVSMEQIIEDYVLTNDTVDLEKALFEHPQGSFGLGAEGPVLASATRNSRDPLLKAWPEYLAAAFAQIAQDEGSIEDYLRNRLGLTDELRASLRDHLLEP